MALDSVVFPLQPPNSADVYSVCPGIKTEPMDFTKHMQNFYVDHPEIAFSTMGRLLHDGVRSQKKKTWQSEVKQWKRTYLRQLKFECPVKSITQRIRQHDKLLEDVVHDIPPATLAELLHEELEYQRCRELFQEMSTGGALGCFSLEESQDFSEGYLVYPSGEGLQSLNFHQMALNTTTVDGPQLLLRGSPITFELSGTVRQVSIRTPPRGVFIGVRSNYFCGAWCVAVDTCQPKALEVIQTSQPATCLMVSPHVSGELLVASESGAVHLWTVGKGLSKIREDDSNIFFNAESAWRWCEFSAHPRVMIYADRTGAEMTDFRTGDNVNISLFRIGNTSGCKSGERLIQSSHLSEVDASHHLITTQYSAYIVDERMPSIPMLKWDHYMESPPMFAQVLPGATPERNNRLLLGSQQTQELFMMQYQSGCEEGYVTKGACQKLLSPRDALAHLPIMLPHKTQVLEDRLSVPAIGFAAIQSDKHLCVLQLTAAGDAFYQSLQLQPCSSQMQTSIECASGLCAAEPCGSSQEQSWAGLESAGRQGQPSAPMFGNGTIGHCLTRTQPEPSSEALSKWSKWLAAVVGKMKFAPMSLHHIVSTKNLRVSVRQNEKDQNAKLMLRQSFRGRKMYVHSGSGLPSLPMTPVPNSIEPLDWPDDISQRLSMAWLGQLDQWWEEKLGLNQEQRREALRRKRRLEKRAKARRRVDLSRSFTSSVGYQMDSDFSEWTSCSSQDLGSDWDGMSESQLSIRDEPLSPEIPTAPNVGLNKQSFRASSFSTQPADSELAMSLTQDCVVAESVVDVLDSSAFLLSGGPGASFMDKPDKKAKCTKQEILASLFSSQASSQASLEEPLPIMTSSQCSSLSLSQRPPQIRKPVLQSSQPKKRSRMGF